MPYLPGPLILQDAANVGITTTDYDFESDVNDQLAELETIPYGWDPFLSDAGDLLAESSDPFPDVDIGAAMNTLHAYSDPEALLGTDSLVFALGTADVGLASAIGYAPAEAWVDTSSSFVAPAPAEVLGVPIIPPGAIRFDVAGTVGSPAPAPIPNLPNSYVGVNITNLSQYGNSNFRVGDQFQVTATGGPGETVYVYATLNGVDIGGGPQGTIGSDRTFTINGTMGEAQVGIWTEQWWIGNSPVGSFDFIVVEA